MTVQPTKLVAEHAGIRLVVVGHPQAGWGAIITEVRSPQLIQGVELEALTHFPDDRGSFAELFRFGEPGITRDYNSGSGSQVQVSYTLAYPGAIKAIHYHFDQTDLWAPLSGMFQVFLCDLRESSPSCGQVNTLFVGTHRPWKLRIPPGVGHGFKVAGTEAGVLVYATNRFYNPQDEGRMAYDDPDVNYDWVTRPK
jgi:dTDP-4-dehydrorhamnose 3,5-epimerase